MHVELWFSLFFLLISAGSVAVTLVSFLMLVISVFSHFSSVNLTRRLSILLIFSRNQCFRFIDFYLFYCFRFHKFLLLCLSFPFLALGLFYSPYKFLRWELRLWLRDSSHVCIQSYKFLSQRCFSHAPNFNIFFFHFRLANFWIPFETTSLTHGFNIKVCCLLSRCLEISVIFLLSISSFTPLCLESILYDFNCLKNLLRFFFFFNGLGQGLPQSMFCGHLNVYSAECTEERVL